MYIRDDVRVVIGSGDTPQLVGVLRGVWLVCPALDLGAVVLASGFQVEGGCW